MLEVWLLDIPTDEDYTKVENFYGLSLLSLVNEDVKFIQQI